MIFLYMIFKTFILSISILITSPVIFFTLVKVFGNFFFVDFNLDKVLELKSNAKK
jgi:hypothetical protein